MRRTLLQRCVRNCWFFLDLSCTKCILVASYYEVWPTGVTLFILMMSLPTLNAFSVLHTFPIFPEGSPVCPWHIRGVIWRCVTHIHCSVSGTFNPLQMLQMPLTDVHLPGSARNDHPGDYAAYVHRFDQAVNSKYDALQLFTLNCLNIKWTQQKHYFAIRASRDSISFARRTHWSSFNLRKWLDKGQADSSEIFSWGLHRLSSETQKTFPVTKVLRKTSRRFIFFHPRPQSGHMTDVESELIL